MRESDVAFRRRLRREATQAEVNLWSSLRGRRFLQLKFRRQHSIGPFVIDFYCPAERLGIEVDGGQHFEAAHVFYDEARSRFLATRGVRIVRFTDAEVLADLDGVLQALRSYLTRRRRPSP